MGDYIDIHIWYGGTFEVATSKLRCTKETAGSLQVDSIVDLDDFEDQTFRYSGSESSDHNKEDSFSDEDAVNGCGSDSEAEEVSCGSYKDDDEWRQSIATIQNVRKEDNENKEKIYDDSEGDVRTPGESEDDDILGKKNSANVPVVNEHTYWNKFIWVVGTRFPTRDAFKDAVKKYVVAHVAGFLNKNVEYVNEYYHKEQYMKSYAFTIPLFPSEKYWPVVDYPLDPPPIKAQPSRPKKNMKRDPHENPKNSGKLTRHDTTMTCSNCKEKGHNKKGCKKGKRPVSEDIFVKKARGRPKKPRVEAPQSSLQASQLTQKASEQLKEKTRGRPKKATTEDTLLVHNDRDFSALLTCLTQICPKLEEQSEY
ncbi:hypothetical protein QVD17_19382 [Tagetes erecta]|uniref:Uncharacterized protein n=1 Tax=Tagetes erecta TaxID=13708 RepID=A0AAD8KJD1_TARER|nr:hypothetical protein QVD17_19382 [Tagetes erecta]